MGVPPWPAGTSGRSTMGPCRVYLGALWMLGAAWSVQAGDFPQIQGQSRPSQNSPWMSRIQEAEQLMRGAPEQARSRFEEVLQQYPQSDGAKRAIEGIAESYVV